MDILAIDVHYRADIANVVGVLFNTNDDRSFSSYTSHVTDIAPYQPGSFYKRELPCILALLKLVPENAYTHLLIDGYVYTNNQGDYGLGGYLYECINQRVPVIGVAKSKFVGNEKYCIPVLRGKSQSPLYISSIGYDSSLAADMIKRLSGEYRFPTILAILDRMTKSD